LNYKQLNTERRNLCWCTTWSTAKKNL